MSRGMLGLATCERQPSHADTGDENEGDSVEANPMAFSRVFSVLVAAAGLVAGARGQVDQVRAAEEPAGKSAAQVALIPVPLPLTGNADERVMASAAKALKSFSSDDKRGIIIFEFQAADGESIGSTGFERALSLARFLAGDQFRRVRTIAYVPISLNGHAVLPVLACEEIVIAPDARFGAAGIDQETIDATMLAAYREMAERRRTVPVPVVLGMLDSSVTVIELQLVGGGKRYVLGEDLESVREDVEVWKEDTLAGAGDPLILAGRKMRVESFASHLAGNRKELAEALHIPPGVVRENEVRQQAWRAIRIDVHDRITASTADELTRVIRDVERNDKANLICLDIDSPGGPAAPAVRIVHLLAGLDSKSLRTVAFVRDEARSVAALIALAADETYAREDAILGGPGDAVITENELEAMREPIQELARMNNRDWSLLLGVVDPDLAVARYRQEGTGAERYFCEEERASQEHPEEWTRVNQLELADGITGLQAEQYGLIVDCVDSLEAALQRFNLEEGVVVAKRNSIVDAIERLAVQPWFARTLLFVAFFALIAEAAAPGIGVPGFISAVCFLLFFWCQFLNHTAGWLEVILFAGGVAFVAFEIFVTPGFGVFGVGGVAMILLSLVLASQTFVFPHNAYQFSQLPQSLMTTLIAGGGVISAIWLLRRFMAESWLFQRFVLSPPAEEDHMVHRESLVDWDYLSGKRGVTVTQLTPSGKARFGDDIVNVISDGLLVSRDTPVRVVAVRGNHILVEPLEES